MPVVSSSLLEETTGPESKVESPADLLRGRSRSVPFVPLPSYCLGFDRFRIVSSPPSAARAVVLPLLSVSPFRGEERPGVEGFACCLRKSFSRARIINLAH